VRSTPTDAERTDELNIEAADVIAKLLPAQSS
jgi:hypothetical protein